MLQHTQQVGSDTAQRQSRTPDGADPARFEEGSAVDAGRGGEEKGSTMGGLGSGLRGRKASGAGETRSGDHDRRFSTTSMVSLEQSTQPPSSFGISFETSARFDTALPSSEFPPRANEHFQGTPQLFSAPPIVFAPVTCGPPPPHFFDYSPPSGFTYLPPPVFGPPPFLPPPTHHLPFHPFESSLPPPSPYLLSAIPEPLPLPTQHAPFFPEASQHSYPTPEDLVAPKPCAVWNCFRPTFCQLSPCGCGLCRDHLGTVIRGAKVDENSETEGEGKKKRFKCVACRAKSHTMGPAASEEQSPGEVEIDAGANEGSSKAGSRASGDESLFSVSFTHSRSTSRDTFSPPPSIGPSPHQYSSPLPPQPPFAPGQPFPPPPPYEPSTAARRVHAFSSPPISNPRLSFSFHSHAPIPLVPTAPRRQTSFKGTRTPAPAGPLERLSQAELVELSERGSPRWKDWRSPVTDPSEPYQLEQPKWPIVKVENIPFNTTVKDVEAWLPSHCLPSPEYVVNSIHIILHRPTGRTLPHCYLEMNSLAEAHKIMQELDRSHLGNRTVRLKWERRGELMRDLFSQEQYFTVPAPSAAAAPLPRVPTNYKFPQQIINSSGMHRLLEFCSSPYPVERPFLNIVSILAKFPWASKGLYDDGQRDALFDTVLAAMGVAARHGEKEPLFMALLHKMSIAALTCEGFTDEQKETVTTFKAEEHFSEPSSLRDAAFPPLSPPSSTTKPETPRRTTISLNNPLPPPSPPHSRNDLHDHHEEVATSQRAPLETPPPSPAARKVVKLPRSFRKQIEATCGAGGESVDAGR